MLQVHSPAQDTSTACWQAFSSRTHIGVRSRHPYAFSQRSKLTVFPYADHISVCFALQGIRDLAGTEREPTAGTRIVMRLRSWFTEVRLWIEANAGEPV